ncbi:hypothetical protein SCUCBS95973_002321 [Sporothrix curviconia]|uniref:DUF2293 domain-containing protein n=1 Tax=Sporothrix curviconia TaxID=1260050 RepID=A0ABP0B675_9PEZI
MAKDEQVVLPTTPMPRGYVFVRKGNVYITAHCRRATHAEGRVVYLVVRDLAKSKTVVGIRCPQHVVAAVRAAEQATRTARHAATNRRDAAQAEAFRAALLARYPAVPADTVPRIVQHAMQKHAGRVARTGTLDLAARVRLAVRAHIRHCWTDYEALLREGRGENTTSTMSKEKNGKGKKKRSKKHAGNENEKLRAEARALTVGRVNAIEKEWARGVSCVPGLDKKKAEKAKRKLGETREKGLTRKTTLDKTKAAATTTTRARRQQQKTAGSKKEMAIVVDSDDGEDEEDEDDDDGDSDYDVDSDSDGDGSDSNWT